MTTDLHPGYFGPPQRRRPDEDAVPTPIGEKCLWCEEVIVLGDTGTVSHYLQVMHYECSLRSAVGSVGHQQGTCSCFGGTEEDPEGMTTREAAIAAAQLFHRDGVIRVAPVPE